MNQTSDLCVYCKSLPSSSGFKLKTKEGEKLFCCQGCLSIYQMLNTDNSQDSAKDLASTDQSESWYLRIFRSLFH
ncbi:MAG: heavy metal translocating P-type ATPase metal-binding domain-containing protein [Methylomonas sp.]